jgi:RNA polymerase sigma factor (TIGR02999 family)
MSASEDVTQLLNSWRDGDPAALERLMPIVYDELRAIARRQLSRENPNLTVQATVLVHEAYLRLVDQRRASYTSRAHFLAVAANMIRRILVDHARARKTAKRSSHLKLPIDAIPEPAAPDHSPDALLIDLDQALDDLEQKYPGKSRLVELRYFGGLTIEETAEVLHISPTTVKRDWLTAKAWLARAMGAGRGAALLDRSHLTE